MILPARFSDGISLSLRLKLLTGLWVGLAALSVVLTLLLSLRLENAASVIEEAGNLRMQAYRLAYMAGEGSPRAQIDNQVAEFEKSLKRIAQSDAIHPLIPSDTPLAYDLIQSMLIIDWQAHILPPAPVLPATDSGRSLPLCRKHRTVFAGIGKCQRKKHMVAQAFSMGNYVDDAGVVCTDAVLAPDLGYPAAAGVKGRCGTHRTEVFRYSGSRRRYAGIQTGRALFQSNGRQVENFI